MADSDTTGATPVTVTISYETSYGTAPSDYASGSGEVFTSDMLPVLTAQYYIHDGWYTSDTFEDSARIIVDETTVPWDIDSLVLYAKWNRSPSIVSEIYLVDIANAIREQTDGEDLLTPGQMADEILAIKGRILGHRFVAGTFTLTEDTTSTYTVMSADDLYAALEAEFPDALYGLGTYVIMPGANRMESASDYLVAQCWLDGAADASSSIDANEWLAGFLPRVVIGENNGLMGYGNSSGTFEGTASTTGIQIDSTNGLIIGFDASHKGLSGNKYNWLVFAVDHGIVTHHGGTEPV